MSQSDIILTMPATSQHLVLARAAVASVCASLDFGIDRIEDVKLAVDEACALLLADTDPEQTLTLTISPTSSHNTIAVSVAAVTRRGRSPRTDSFSWTVLSALVDDVTAQATDGTVSITLQAGQNPVTHAAQVNA